jgi:hypothetical protein
MDPFAYFVLWCLVCLAALVVASIAIARGHWVLGLVSIGFTFAAFFLPAVVELEEEVVFPLLGVGIGTAVFGVSRPRKGDPIVRALAWLRQGSPRTGQGHR